MVMKKVKWVLGIVLAAGLCGAGSLFAADAAKPDRKLDNDSLFADDVVAAGKGVQIKRSELDAAIASYNATLASQGQPPPAVSRNMMESKLLDQLVFTRLLLNMGTEEEKKKAKEQADTVIAEFKKNLSSEEAFNRRVTAVGMTPETFRVRAQEDALKRLVIEREVISKITISDEAAKKFYDENPQRFEVQESVKVAHILLMTIDPATRSPLSPDKQKEKKELIQKILARARSGEDFAKLAKEFSEDPGSKDRGGEYVFGRGQMDPDFESAAFGLEPNQISDVVTTRFGYHIIKLFEKKPARKLTLAEVSARLKDSLRNEEAANQLPGYYEKLKKEAAVKITLSDSGN